MKTLVSVIALALVLAWPSVGEAQSKKSTARSAAASQQKYCAALERRRAQRAGAVCPAGLVGLRRLGSRPERPDHAGTRHRRRRLIAAANGNKAGPAVFIDWQRQPAAVHLGRTAARRLLMEAFMKILVSAVALVIALAWPTVGEAQTKKVEGAQRDDDQQQYVRHANVGVRRGEKPCAARTLGSDAWAGIPIRMCARCCRWMPAGTTSPESHARRSSA